jgi:hypothetical protein
MIPPLAYLAEKGLLLWLALMALVVGWRCISGDINLAGMLAHDAKDQADQRPAPDRVQLLVSFIFAVVAYARLALAGTQGHDAALSTQLPEAPNELVLLFVGSHSIYLIGKFRRSIPRGGPQT